MPKSDLKEFLNSIADDLKLHLPLDDDYSIKNGNIFGTMDWASRSLTAVTSDEDDYFIPNNDNYDDENEEDILDTLLNSLKVEDDYYTTSLPSTVPLNSQSLIQSEMSCINGTIFTKEIFNNTNSLLKISSLDDITSYSSFIPFVKGPFLLPVPPIPTDDNFSNDDEYPTSLITKLFQGIPSNSWILPYVLVGAAMLAEQNEQKKILCADSDVCLSPQHNFYEDVKRIREKKTTPTSSSSQQLHIDENYTDGADDELDDHPEEENSFSHPINLSPSSSRKKYRNTSHHQSDEIHDSHSSPSDHDKAKHKNHQHSRQHSNDSHTHDSDHHHKDHKKHHGLGHLFRRKHKDKENNGADELDVQNYSPREELSPSDSDTHHDHGHEKREKHHHGIGHLFHRKHKHKGDDELDDSHNRSPRDVQETSPSESDTHHDHGHEKHRHGIGHLFHRKHKHKGDDELDDSHNHSPRDVQETSPSESDTHHDHGHKNKDKREKHHHGIGHLFHRKHKHKAEEHPHTSDIAPEGSFLISHDENGVYITSKPRAHSTDTLHSESEISDKNNLQRMPKFMQHLFLFPNFDDLGVVFIRPVVDSIWVPRHLYLWDNYLFETIPDSDNNLPLGFANLSGGNIQQKHDKKMKKKNLNNQPNDPAHHLRLSFLINSTKSSKKVEILLCGRDKNSTSLLYEKLLTSVNLSVEKMYEYDLQAKPLGVGRYARVVRAINRHLRDVITHSHSNHSLSSQSADPTGVSSQPNPTHTPGQCALKLVNKIEFWNQVKNGVERKDTLAREVLAQSHILNSLIHSATAGGTSTSTSSRTHSFNGCYDEVSVSELELPIVILNGILETCDELVMDMELMHCGDLYEKLVEHGTSFKEIQVKHIAIQLVQAVALCQANGIAHRDIKLSNITFPERVHQELLNDHSKHKPMQIKLADFGMAGFVNKEGYLWGRCGTPGYVAPEIFRSGVREGYSVNVDMFSLGVAIFTLLSGYEPFAGDDIQQIIEANKLAIYDFDGIEWKHVSDEAKDFVRRAMSADPKYRLSVHEALDHPWLEEYGGTLNYPPRYASSSQQKKCVIS